jgi:hypothetical protein
MDTINEGIRGVAMETAALQDSQIAELLDYHGLKNFDSKEKLEKAGYKLIHEVEHGTPMTPSETKHTVTLYKIVGSKRWSTRVDFKIQ